MSVRTFTANFEFVRLQDILTEQNIHEYAAEFKRLRLQSLLLDGQWFYKTYAEEVSLPESAWIERLLEPGFEHWIIRETAVFPLPRLSCQSPRTTPTTEADSASSTSRPVHFCGFSGNVIIPAGQMIPNAGSKPATCLTSKMQAVYIEPQHRGKRLGEKMFTTSINYQLNKAREAGEEEIVFQIAAWTRNERAVKVYRNVGFVEVERRDIEKRDKSGFENSIFMELRINLRCGEDEKWRNSIHDVVMKR